MSLQIQKVKQRPVFPLVYVLTRTSQKVFLVKMPSVSKLIINHSDLIGSSKYLQFYKSQKRVYRITILTLTNSRNLSQIRNILYNLRSFTVFTIYSFQKLFFTFFRRLDFLIIKLNKASTHSILKKQTIPGLKVMITPDAHFSRMRIAKLAEKIDVLDTFVVNVEPFAFMKNLRELSFNFDENFERNEVKVKKYDKIIQSIKLKKLRIQESINGISKFRYLDFLKLANQYGFTLDVIISPRRLSLNHKIYYSPSNVFDNMITEGVNSFTFIGTPKISTGNLLDSPALCTNDEQYLIYLNGMIKHFNRFKTDISYEQIQSPKVLDMIYQILTLDNASINVLTITMSMNEDFYQILDNIAPYLEKISQIQLALEITKEVQPGQFKLFEERLSKILSPTKLTELTLKVQINNVSNLDNLISLLESIQHLFWIKTFVFRLLQVCSPIIFKLLLEKLRKSQNLDLGFQCVFSLNHLGLADKNDYNVTQNLVDLASLILKKSIQFNYEGTVLSTHFNMFRTTIQAVEELLRVKYFTKIISFNSVTQTGKPLFTA